MFSSLLYGVSALASLGATATLSTEFLESIEARNGMVNLTGNTLSDAIIHDGGDTDGIGQIDHLVSPRDSANPAPTGNSASHHPHIRNVLPRANDLLDGAQGPRGQISDVLSPEIIVYREVDGHQE